MNIPTVRLAAEALWQLQHEIECVSRDQPTEHRERLLAFLEDEADLARVRLQLLRSIHRNRRVA